MSFPLPQSPPALVVLDDIPCRSCGYNLRTLAHTGFCPECSTPVAASMGGGYLRNADPLFLRRLNAGLKLLRITVWCFALAPFVFRQMPFPTILSAICIAASGAMLAGNWLLTTRDPSGLGEDEYRTLRIMARDIGVLQLVTFTLMTGCSSAPPAICFFTQYAAFAIQFMWGLGLLLYLRLLSRRAVPVSRNFGMDGALLAFVAMFIVIAVVMYLYLLPFGWPLIRSMLSSGWINLLFVYPSVATFSKVFNREWIAARLPTPPRTAGSFVRSIRELFGGVDSRDNKPG